MGRKVPREGPLHHPETASGGAVELTERVQIAF